MTLSSTLEKTIHRNGTKRFIAADPTDIVLIPKAGAWVNGTKSLSPSAPRASQRFKLIWSDESGIVRETPNGVRRFDFVLLGEYNAVVEIDDTFDFADSKYRITYIYPFNDYEVKAGGVVFSNSTPVG